MCVRVGASLYMTIIQDAQQYIIPNGVCFETNLLNVG